MATLSFNPTRIRTPGGLHLCKPKPRSLPFPQSIKTAKRFSADFRINQQLLHRFRSNSVSESSISVPEEVEVAVDEDEAEDDPTLELAYLDSETDPESITEWELDFCSRPILDIRGKKVWELVACDNSLSLQYTKYFPNNVINSITLRDAISSITEELGVPLPEKIRFFRSQMQTIITKACTELGVKPIPSKRCLSLLLWLEERYETVYTRHPGFQKGSKPLLALDNPFPMELPDNLFGERWAFVQLPFSAVQEEVSNLNASFMFGSSLDLDLLGIEIDDNSMIPGLSVASSRAQPLAAWMNGMEVYSVEADTSRACLILSVGISTRYVYATYKKNPVTTAEAEAWEAAKKACGGLHFLAIQDDLDSEDCVGFWLLLDLPPPPV
ncbi:protein TAB2 homolog, chloroplastic isoform X2 [Cucurbita maxima]|uniref:Protein TAB2 homolog, chloroplastic isoform X2 n=1 Tax=Cucurbita maxima TaxID=3661 RepID=A0A6J1KZX3_CUCMA|nr:protein TAB2 homolog, chloroplastic isoform X2 [Cucurbita maxima]